MVRELTFIMLFEEGRRKGAAGLTILYGLSVGILGLLLRYDLKLEERGNFVPERGRLTALHCVRYRA